MKITVETTVAAPIAAVWKAYTSADDMTRWNFASEDWHCPRANVDLRVGGQFSSRMEARDGSTGFDFEGTYTKLVPNQLLEYSFGDRIAQVQFESRPDTVHVRVTFDAEDTFPVEQQREGWLSILENFKRHVEAGGG